MKRILVTGGAGFVGSHLCEALVSRGDEVVCLDDLSSGTEGNLAALKSESRFAFVQADLVSGIPVDGRFESIFHLASPASPKDYYGNPIGTLRVGSEGTLHVLERASADNARVVFTSTSEVYGDPQETPQREDYWGHVNPVGPRSVYDEAKRYAEALCTSWRREHGADVRICRIFNTYGPRLREEDGRVVSNFICQALRGHPLTLYGDGSQTRSFMFVSDLVAGLMALEAAEENPGGPVNLGNPVENTVRELALLVGELTGMDVTLTQEALPEDDPRRRLPDIARAISVLNWEPRISLRDGLVETIAYFRNRI